MGELCGALPGMFGDPAPTALSAVFPITIQQRDVDPSAEIVVLEGNLVGFVEEIGVEHDRPIGSIGNLDRFGTYLLEPGENLRLVFVIVIFLKNSSRVALPCRHDQPTGFLIEIGLIRRNQKLTLTAAASAWMLRPRRALSCLKAQAWVSRCC